MPNKSTPTNTEPSSSIDRPKCGIVMPISLIDGLLPSHWEDVKSIITQAVESSGFQAELVSETEESTIIHKTIIQNLYNSDIVVCDVSGKNPNVMFELGIRLTFDKPTVVVKDDKTDYSFDMSPIEHLPYPRDLRFNQIVQFKEKLAAKVKATHDLAKNDASYSTFLKHFGQFTVPKLDQKEVSPDQFIIRQLEDIAEAIKGLERTAVRSITKGVTENGHTSLIRFHLGHLPVHENKRIATLISVKYPGVRVRRSPGLVEVDFPTYMTILELDEVRESIIADVNDISKKYASKGPSKIE